MVGCGVWFGEDSPHNMSTRPQGKQTVNRAELTAVILSVRKALGLLDVQQKLVVHSDSKYCIDGINISMQKWSMDGWTRRGQPLRNADLWQVMQRALTAMKEANIKVEFRHVPAHVGIYGNERADRLAKAAKNRGHKAVPRTEQELNDSDIDRMADSIIAACCNAHASASPDCVHAYVDSD